MALYTYVTLGDRPDQGLGQLYISKNDWQTVQGPQEVRFTLPNVNFYAFADDGGRPDLIELRSGVLVAAFGVRVPQKFCWQHPEHPWNGNYLAFSLNHDETWNNVVRVTSGVLTTHYMGITETATDDELYITYDLGAWGKQPRRDVIGRTLNITIKPDNKSNP